MNLGIAGKISKTFINSKLTPLFIFVALLAGLLAIIQTPKEEEPQIKVPMIDVGVIVPGFTASEIEKRVTNILERELTTLTSVKHIYSISKDSYGLITVRFEVGEDLENSLIKIHHKIQSVKDRLPQEAKNPSVKSYTIDDVPFFTVTFHSKKLNSSEIRQEIYSWVKRLQEIKGVSEFSLIGGERRVVRITPDLEKINQLGISLIELKTAIENSNSNFELPALREISPEPIIETGAFISNLEDLKKIPISRSFGKRINLNDIATISLVHDDSKSFVTFRKEHDSAVTAVFSKKKGENATLLTREMSKWLNANKNEISKDINFSITRDYGAIAKEKSDELIKHLWIATISVMILIAMAMGFRVSLVVGIAVPVTLAITLFVYYMLGYTLNRVTLFALIFSIGILVDDAIVVVENIHRHLSLGFHSAKDLAITVATDEVGNPTILATLAVIIAIMPMAFVGGLMGPYMRPIPIGASFAMIFSLIIAFVITPWASKKLLRNKKEQSQVNNSNAHKTSRLDSLITKIFKPLMSFLIERKRNTAIALALVFALLLSSFALITTKAVKVKLLPFDNKSEFQVLIDLTPGTTLTSTDVIAKKIATFFYRYPIVKDIEVYTGIAAPFSFSGMVKHTFLRGQSYRADIQVNLIDKHLREENSHDFVRKVRADLNAVFGKIPGIKIKILEVPPGPPVMATLLAEIYHNDDGLRAETQTRVEEIFKNTVGVVEADSSKENEQDKLSFVFDRQKGSIHGISQLAATSTVLMALGDLNIYQIHREESEEPIFMRLALDKQTKSDSTNERLLSLLVPSVEGDKTPLKNLMNIEQNKTNDSIFHKNLKTVSYVMGEVSGEEESPIYAVNRINEKLKKINVSFKDIKVSDDSKLPFLKWDGEMDITIEVFKDLGIAFIIALLLIFILITAWYNSFIIPFIIIIPVPLSLIGILFGHYFMDSYFTATSMIGFIAGAGITVRNSIILVDFIELRRFENIDCKTAVIESTIVRFRPILLTALAVIVAALVILFDPVFQGLAISLMTGAIVSSLLSIPLVPILYFWARKNYGVTKSFKNYKSNEHQDKKIPITDEELLDEKEIVEIIDES